MIVFLYFLEKIEIMSMIYILQAGYDKFRKEAILVRRQTGSKPIFTGTCEVREIIDL